MRLIFELNKVGRIGSRHNAGKTTIEKRATESKKSAPIKGSEKLLWGLRHPAQPYYPNEK